MRKAPDFFKDLKDFKDLKELKNYNERSQGNFMRKCL